MNNESFTETIKKGVQKYTDEHMVPLSIHLRALAALHARMKERDTAHAQLLEQMKKADQEHHQHYGKAIAEHEAHVKAHAQQVSEWEKERDRLLSIDKLQGEKGDPGEPGISPDIEDIIERVRPLIPKPLKGEPGKSVDPKSVIDAIKNLQGKDRLHVRHIDGIETIIGNASLKRAKKIDPDRAGGGGDTVAAGTGVTLTKDTHGNVVINASGVSPIFYNDTVSGTIDSTNKVFTVPNTIVSAISLLLGNSAYQAGVDYTVTGAKQITMTVAPDITLAGQPFWLSHT